MEERSLRTGQSPGVKRHDARRAKQTLAQRILHPTAPAGGPRGLPGSGRASGHEQSPDRLSDNANNTIHVPETGPLRHLHGA
jgi:hypothetical protein